MANDVLICIPLLNSRLEYIQRVLLPSLGISLDHYHGPVQFSVSLVAQNIPPEELVRFSSLPRWYIQHVAQPITLCPFGDCLGMWQARCRAALTGYSYYLLADDDFRFHIDAVTRYAEIVKALEAHPKVGTVMCTGVMGGYSREGIPKSDPYYLHPNQPIGVSRGLIVRNLGRINSAEYEAIFPRGVMEWTRAAFRPDNIVGLLPTLEGLSVAKSYNHLTDHYNNPAGATAKILKAYQPLLTEKMEVLYPRFQITASWQKANDWAFGHRLFGENLKFDCEIGGSRDGKPADGCLEYNKVFTPAVVKAVKVEEAKASKASRGCESKSKKDKKVNPRTWPQY